MTPSQIERIRRGIVSRTGANVRVSRDSGADANQLLVMLEDVDPRVSFTLGVALGYQRLEVSLEVGQFAGPFLSEIGRATPEEKAAFRSLARAIAHRKGRVDLVVNGLTCSPEEPDRWPSEWKAVQLRVTRMALDVEGATLDERARLIEEWASLVLLMILALAATPEEQPEGLLQEPGLPEGARVAIVANRYERSRINRLRCLAIRGLNCSACGMSFGEVYGDIGAGFIHVHHVTPVSEMGAGYIVDPAVDLVPVCPNCHAMIHRRDPALPVDDLRQRLQAREH